MIEKKRVDGSESAVHSLKEQIKKMKWIDWKALFMLALAFVPGKVWRVVSAPIWVVTEYEHLARDNGYCFFKYIKYDHPEIKAYYPIKKNSADYKKIKDIGGYIEFGSFRHYCLFWGATYYIGTTKCYGFPYRRICEDIVQWNLHSFKYIFLNHGFTRGYSSIVDGNETRYDLLITCAEKDSDIIISENNQKRKIVKCIGFARHDSLQNEVNEKIKKQIVIMPTWRKWLDCRGKENQDIVYDNFINSEFYENYTALLHDKKLLDFLNENNLYVIFYLHEYAQAYSKYFKSDSPKIIIGTNDRYDIQRLLKESIMLITDYSSVCYDFAYLRKPIIYYQFDKEKFEKMQYSEGNKFSYEEDGFGDIVNEREKLYEKIEKYNKSGFEMEKKYIDRVNSFFKYHDHDNCKRIYNEICKLK